MARSTPRRGVAVAGLLAVATSLAACATTPRAPAQGKSTGPVAAATSTTSAPAPAAPSTTATTAAARPLPKATTHGTPAPPRSGASASTSTTASTATVTTSGGGGPPDVVGQSLTLAERRLRAAGYGMAAHPWGGSCATPNQIMQQVPPSEGEVQVYYCAQAS